MISALPQVPVSVRRDEPKQAEAQWAHIALHAPQMAATFGRYLTQISTFLSPNSVTAADLSFRTVTWFLDERRPDVRSVAGLDRNLMEDFAVWLSERPGLKGPLSVSSRRQRLGMLHMFFERIIDWDWPDAPARNPVWMFRFHYSARYYNPALGAWTQTDPSGHNPGGTGRVPPASWRITNRQARRPVGVRARLCRPRGRGRQNGRWAR
jgi:hypothetical protein